MRILVVEDDQVLLRNLEEILKRNFYAVDISETKEEAEFKLSSEDYDLIVMDWKLPDGTGVDICRKIRNDGCSTPVLMLTANSQLEDKVEGLDAGADDYLTKPFEIKELLARIRALGRRKEVSVKPVIEIADLKIDTNLKRVWRNKEEIELSPKEYSLLEYLARHLGESVSRTDLLTHVWDENVNLFSNTVDVHIRYLRNKIDKNDKTRLIQTVKGEGYALCEN